MPQYHMIVSGKVQGVGFRYYMQMAAAKHNVYGWVKNGDNDTVEIVAEGEKDTLQKFLDEVKIGSPFSRVDHVEITRKGQKVGFRSFTIKY